MGRQRNVKRMKKLEDDIFTEKSKEQLEWERRHRRKLRQLQEDMDESGFPPVPWYEE